MTNEEIESMSLLKMIHASQQEIIEKLSDLEAEIEVLRESIDELEDNSFDLDEEGDDDNECRSEFEEIASTKDAINFMKEWLDKGAIRDVLKELNDVYDYKLKTKGSEEELLAELEGSDIDHDEITECIEEVVDLDEE